jgi:hypothetical protein
VYQQAVDRLIRAADQVAVYRADLATFADTLAGKRWGGEVTGPIQDMDNRLTALEGTYRDLAAQMKHQGDQGSAAYDQASWVPSPDAVLSPRDPGPFGPDHMSAHPHDPPPAPDRPVGRAPTGGLTPRPRPDKKITVEYTNDAHMARLATAVDNGDLSFHAVGLYAHYLMQRTGPDDTVTLEDISGATDDYAGLVELVEARTVVVALPDLDHDSYELELVLLPEEAAARDIEMNDTADVLAYLGDMY